MDHALPISEHFRFLFEDFEKSWNQLAALDRPESAVREYGRGNYMFALMCMVILELVKLTAKQLPNHNFVQLFSDSLNSRDTRYFIDLNAENPKPNLPFHLIGGDPKRTLLSLIFDLTRNGKAHYYDAILAKTTSLNVPHFTISYSGAKYGRTLVEPTAKDRKEKHLKYDVIDNDGKTKIAIVGLRTDYLFQDLKFAAQQSGVSSVITKFTPFIREIKFDLESLKGALSTV